MVDCFKMNKYLKLKILGQIFFTLGFPSQTFICVCVYFFQNSEPGGNAAIPPNLNVNNTTTSQLVNKTQSTAPVTRKNLAASAQQPPPDQGLYTFIINSY